MDAVLLASTAITTALAVPAWALVWRSHFRKAMLADKFSASDLEISDLAQEELREAMKLALDDVPRYPKADKGPAFSATPAAAVLDGLGATYGNWIQTSSLGVLGEEVSCGVAHALANLDSVLGSQLEVAGLALQDIASFVHHVLDPTLAIWFEQIGGTQFVHLVAQKFAALDAAFQGDGLLEIGGQSISPAIPWATLIVSSAKEIWLLIGGKTTPLRAVAHISLDTALVTAGVFAGTLAAGALAALLTALDVTVTYGAAHALAGILGVAGGFAGAKLSGEIKGAKLEVLCKDLAQVISDFDGLGARLQGELDPKLQTVVTELSQKLQQESLTIEATFERSRRDLVTGHAQRLDAFAAGLPVGLNRAICEARIELASALEVRRRLGVRYFVDIDAGPRALARRRQCENSLAVLLSAKASLMDPAATGFERRWSIVCRAAAEDPLRKSWSLVRPVVEGAAQIRRDVRTARDTALRNIRSVQVDLQAQLSCRKAAIFAEGSAQLTPLAQKLRKLVEAVEAEGAALGKTARA